MFQSGEDKEAGVGRMLSSCSLLQLELGGLHAQTPPQPTLQLRFGPQHLAALTSSQRAEPGMDHTGSEQNSSMRGVLEEDPLLPLLFTPRSPPPAPPPVVFLLQTAPPICAANHHDNRSGLLLKIHHRSISRSRKTFELRINKNHCISMYLLLFNKKTN